MKMTDVLHEEKMRRMDELVGQKQKSCEPDPARLFPTF